MHLTNEAAAIGIAFRQYWLLSLPFTKCALTWVPLLPLQINYQPSTIRQNSESKIQPHPDQPSVQKEEIRGQRTRGDYPPQQQSDFQQAGDRYRSFDPVRCCCKVLGHAKLAMSALAVT